MKKIQTLNIIHCGQVGKSFALLLKSWLSIQCVYNSTLDKAKRSEAFIGAGEAVSDPMALKPANITFIAASDEQLIQVSQALASLEIWRPGDTIFHASGTLSSEILDPFQSKKMNIASLHPIKSFADPKKASLTFNGTFCSLEGTPIAKKILSELFGKIGADLFSIEASHKSIYHSACVFASNYLVTITHLAHISLKQTLHDIAKNIKPLIQNTCGHIPHKKLRAWTEFEYHLQLLFDSSVYLFKQSGVAHDKAETISRSLILNTADYLMTFKAAKLALTGPIKRGDIAVIREHLNILPEPIKQVYARIGLETVALTELPTQIKNQLSALLQSQCP